MALNISQNSVFPAHHPLEDGLFSAIKFGNYRNLNWELENPPDSRWDKTEKAPDDIIDLLPPDPFGMDLSSTFTAITGWLEAIENDLGLSSLGFISDRAEMGMAEDQLFAGLNMVWNGGVNIQPEFDNMKIQQRSIGDDREMPVGSCDGGFVLEGNAKEFMGLSYEKYEVQGGLEVHSDVDGGAPHDALIFALGYLSVKDLLSIEGVCKSLRDAVRNDPLLWRSIHIEQPLNEKITDDTLLRLTSRAQGTLHCLSAVECLRVTDKGLKMVLESNPGLEKLCVPGCVRISVEGILCNLRAFMPVGKLGIKHLRIGGLYGITNKQYEELKFLLGADNQSGLSVYKPRIYSGGQLYLSCEDDRAIDIEACPKCHNLRQVYDCPADTCQGKHQNNQLCRGCLFCIARCFFCGQCINGGDYEETFCLDSICLRCWEQIYDGQDGQREMDIHSF